MYECTGCGGEFTSPMGAVECEDAHKAEDAVWVNR